MRYPELQLTPDLVLLDTKLLPPPYRHFDTTVIKHLLELGLKEDGYLFVGESDPEEVSFDYPLYMTLCGTIDLPDWDRPCTLHITLYDRHTLIIRHLKHTPPPFHPSTLHVFSYAEWDTALRDVLEPMIVHFNSPLVVMDDLIESTLEYIVCQRYGKEVRLHPEVEAYLSRALYSRVDMDSPSLLGRLLKGLFNDIAVDDKKLSLYLYTIDTKRRVINLVFVND